MGYVILGYPWSFTSIGLGIVLGAATLLASLAARWINNLEKAIPTAVRAATAFAVAFVVFEGILYAVSFFVLGGLEDFTVGIVSRILVINSGAFVGLLILQWWARAPGFIPSIVARTASMTGSINRRVPTRRRLVQRPC